MDLPKYQQGSDRNYEKRLNTIKQVNSLYILDSENQLTSTFPALLNGLKRKPPWIPDNKGRKHGEWGYSKWGYSE